MVGEYSIVESQDTFAKHFVVMFVLCSLASSDGLRNPMLQCLLPPVTHSSCLRGAFSLPDNHPESLVCHVRVSDPSLCQQYALHQQIH